MASGWLVMLCFLIVLTTSPELEASGEERMRKAQDFVSLELSLAPSIARRVSRLSRSKLEREALETSILSRIVLGTVK